MKPGLIYRGSYDDVQATSATDKQLDVKTFTVNIYDTSIQIEDAENETVVKMDMADDPCRFVTSNNDEDKFSPILSLTAEIKVHTDENVNLNTFAGGDDNRFYTEVLLETTIVFKGFLLLQDLQQDFMPDPNVLLLVASDNIPVLKDIPLTDFSNENPVGFNRLIDYIVLALSKTKLLLPVKVFNNLREKDTRPFTSDASFVTGPNQIGVFAGASFFRAGKKIRVSNTASNNIDVTVESVVNAPLLGTVTLNVAETLTTEAVAVDAVFTDISANFYSDNFIEAKTFEKEIGESEDCYAVLAKILGEHCRLIQQWGTWWIISVDELDNNDLYATNFDSEGEFVSQDDPTTYTKNIGSNESIFFINEDAIVKPTMPHKYIKETFKLTPPKEIICNIDFARGGLITASVGSSTFFLDDWTHGKEQASALTLATPTAAAYIKRNYDGLGYEKDRFAVVEHETDGGAIRSCPVPVGQGDRITLSFDYALSADSSITGSVSPGVAYALLFGDDGTFWTMSFGSVSFVPGSWHQSNAGFTSNLRLILDTYTADDINQTERKSVSAESLQIPVDGKLYIQLRNPNFNSEASDIYFSGLQLDYKAYINNGYLPVKEQYHKISATVNNNVRRENEVFISDSPRKIFKGGLFKPYYDDFILVETFYKGNIYPAGDPPDDELKKFGEWQAWWIWNQFRLCNREFDYTAQGLDTNTLIDTVANPVSPVHKFFLTDGNESTWGRHFMLLHHEANTHLGEWEGFLSEVYNEEKGKDYGSATSASNNLTGYWWAFLYNDGGADHTVYFFQVTEVNPGWYRENTPAVPPFPSDVDLDNDYTYVGDVLQDILDWLGLTIDDMITFEPNAETSIVSTTSTVITATHEFKYVLE